MIFLLACVFLYVKLAGAKGIVATTGDRTIAYLRSGPARRLIRQRKAWVETVFGDGKERRGLRRARCRGFDAVRIQALLTATAQDIRKLALHRPPGPVVSPT